MAKRIKKQNIARTINRNPLPEYEKEFLFESNGVPTDPKKVRTTAELIAYLDHNKDASLDAHIMCLEKETGRAFVAPISKAKLKETFKENNKLTSTAKFREAYDSFARDTDMSSVGTHTVGNDFIPLLGGPFYKQLYYYNDYLQAHGQAFYAFHHDPIARCIVNVTRQFVLGRGFRIDVISKDEDQEKLGQVVWDAFSETNDINRMMEHLCDELCVYGEDMIWWLPDNETKIQYNLRPGQEAPKGIIPRVRLIDPSNFIEIVTFPEDITRVLYYVWLTPTQYQIYTGADGGNVVPSTKFIYRHIPADQLMHVKVNCMSNEKRGRSDLYPIFGYLKRLRDTVNYAIIGEQKNAAWGIDTTVEGDQADIDNYIASQDVIAPAGSEFVHTAAVKREYLANTGSGKAASNTFDWCLSMIASGAGIPIQYLNVHLSGGSTKASSLVATEPVAKKFEERQLVIERVLKQMATRLFKKFGITAEIEVSFPEIATQDRSTKLKDLVLGDQAEYITHERAAEIYAKEMGITEYDYETEMAKRKQENADGEDLLSPLNPLTQPGQPIAQKGPQQPAQGPQQSDPKKFLSPTQAKPRGVTADDRKAQAKADGSI